MHDHSPEPAPARPPTDAAEAAVQVAFQAILHRPAEPHAVQEHGRRLREGEIDAFGLTQLLLRSGEHARIVGPLATLVRNAYALLFDRAPTQGELTQHVAAFRGSFGSDDAALTRLAAPHPEDLLGIRPLNLEMDVTNQCNIRCVMCYFSDPAVGKRPRQDLQREQYHRVADQTFAWMHRVCLGFGTEPTLHPYLVEFATIAKQRGVPKVYFNSNGQLLKPALAAGLLAAGLDALNVSVDAGTAATYERVRRGARWHQLLANLLWLRDEKRRRGVRSPHLSLSFVMMRSNLGELDDFVRLAVELGADAVHLQHMVPYAELPMDAESLRGHAQLCNERVARAADLAGRLGLTLRVPDEMDPTIAEPARLDFERARRNYDLALRRDDEQRGCCPFPWHFLAMDLDGSLLPCGWWHQGERMGNLFSQDFAAVWQGEPIRRLRRDLEDGALGANCRLCPASGMGSAKHGDSFATRSHDWRKPSPTAAPAP